MKRQALQNLVSALIKYKEANVDWPQAINPGHDVHNAVVQVESFYPRKKLPAQARIFWMDLLQLSRGSRKPEFPTEAMEAVIKLIQWAQDELDQTNLTKTTDDGRL